MRRARAGLTGSAARRVEIVAVIETVAEPLELILWCHGSDETVDETAARVRSELQDNLAQSSFAWDEQRG